MAMNIDDLDIDGLDIDNIKKPKSMKLKDILNQVRELDESREVVRTEGYLEQHNNGEYGTVSFLYSTQEKKGKGILIEGLETPHPKKSKFKAYVTVAEKGYNDYKLIIFEGLGDY